jgi:hypothetical protein
VVRRTHQSLVVPQLPTQSQCGKFLIKLSVEGRSGGWGDRSGDKSARYIKYLELDLIDYPDDPRTV